MKLLCAAAACLGLFLFWIGDEIMKQVIHIQVHGVEPPTRDEVPYIPGLSIYEMMEK